MKLTHLLESTKDWDWNTKTEKQQIAMVRRHQYNIVRITNPSEPVQLAAVTQNGDAVRYIKNPSEAVQAAAVNQDAFSIGFIRNPITAVIRKALMDPLLINNQQVYDREVKRLFANNTLLMKKWLRYGENMRNQ